MMEYLSPTGQYGDLKGKVSVDEGDDQNLADFAKSKGVDTGQYFPIGVDYYREKSEHLSIVTVHRDIASSFDDCEKYAKEHGGELPAVWFGIDATLEELFAYFKRFGLTLQRRFDVGRIAKTDTQDLT